MSGPKTYKELELRNLKIDSGTIYEPNNLQGRIRTNKNAKLSITWQYRYQSVSKGGSRDIACGTWPKISMSEIRKKRDYYFLQVANGLDPHDELERTKLFNQEELERTKLFNQEELKQARLRAVVDETELKTVTDMFAWYIENLNHADGNKAFRAIFDNHLKPTIGDVLVKDLTPDQIRECLRKIVADGKNRTAEIAFENLRSVLRNGEKEQPWRRLLIEMNPIDVIQIDRILDSDYEGRRDRYLSRDEIKELDTRLHQVRQTYENAVGNKYQHEQPLKKRTELALWLMLSTLTRVTETTLARWEHVDFDRREWFIPRENVKRLRGNAHTAHLIYLSDFTINIIEQLKELTGHTEWLFPNEKRNGPINNKTFTKQVGDRQIMPDDPNPSKRKRSSSLVVGTEKWTPHDLRRTGATQMQALGINLDHIDQCQNHTLNTDSNKSRKNYMHHTYNNEMKEAWAKWGDLLCELAPHALK